MTQNKRSILKQVSNGAPAVNGHAATNGMALTAPRQARFSEEDVYNTLMRNFNSASKQLANNDFDVPFSRDGWRVNVGLGKFERLDAELGYPYVIQPRDYHRLYSRGGIAARVVNIWPDECWAAYPELYQTERPGRTQWEKAWEDLQTKTLIWHYMHRADRMSRIGQFGVMFLGLNVPKNGNLATAAPGIDPVTGVWDDVPPVGQELNYLRVFHQENVTIQSTEADQSSPRYGQPSMYEVNFSAPINSGSVSSSGKMASLTQRTKVHWTRVMHLADNCEDGEVFGSPAMEQVFNYVLDVKKVAGASAEMFYKGGFPGYAFQTNPELTGEAVLDKDAIKEEVENYTRGLQRFLTAVGGSWKSLAPQVANPGPHIKMLIDLICATLGVPVKIFMGTESGHLASTQDSTAWKERLTGRQRNYLEPRVVRPFVDRMMGLGVLPRIKKYTISWQDLKALSEADRAEIALKQVQTLMQYLTGQVGKVLPLSMLYSHVMGLSQSQVDAVMAQLKIEEPIYFDPLLGQPTATAAGVGNPDKLPVALPAATASAKTAPGSQAGGRTGSVTTKKAGRPAGKLEKVKP